MDSSTVTHKNLQPKWRRRIRLRTNFSQLLTVAVR
jgi:hypothetical protein